MKTVTAETLKPRLTAEAEIAFLDIREHGQYGEGHPFFCVNVPYSVLEHRTALLVPRKTTAIVLMDDGDGICEKAAHILEREGFADVQTLQGGVQGWTGAGFGLFKGVNVPSKTFGELVEHEMGTPSISAEELKTKLDGSEPIILLDGRTPQEFETMSVPGARSCPNGELAYRWPRIATDDTTPVIINCAGRTRSIIGAETLRQLGFENPIFALRNGTQGWRLAGFDLCHGQRPDALAALRPEEYVASSVRASDIVNRHSIEEISLENLMQWQSDTSFTTYLLDVRSSEEYEKGHIPGARHAPGGQLIQATDQYVAVRGARLVLCDDTRLRAATTAMWLQLMGYRVSVLVTDVSQLERRTTPGPTPADGLSPDMAREHQAAGAEILDASSAMQYRKAHIRGTRWVTRARLNVPESDHVIVTGQGRALIGGIVADLREMGVKRVEWFCGEPESWTAVGFELETTPEIPSDDDCIDYLFFVHDRHDGNLDAARQYLAWEQGLLEQLDDQERNFIDLKKRLNSAAAGDIMR